MHWYLAKLVFQIPNANDAARFDEQMWLIQADELAWALEKARVFGWLEQSGAGQQAIGRRFVEVSDIQRLPVLENGMQLFTHTVAVENADEYVQVTKLNATKSYHRALHDERTCS